MKAALWAGTIAAVIVFLTIAVSPWLGLLGASAWLIADNRQHPIR